MRMIKTEKTVTLADGRKFTATLHASPFTPHFSISTPEDIANDWKRFLKEQAQIEHEAQLRDEGDRNLAGYIPANSVYV
jgi:hypothetical protein